MGWFKKIRKFGHKVGHDAKKLGQKVSHTVTKAVDFAEKKALPIAEKVAGGLKKGLAMVEPLVGTFAPELLPEIEAGKRLAGMADKGLKKAEKGIETVKKGQMKAEAIVKQASSGIQKGFRGDIAGGMADITSAVGEAERANPLKR